MNGTAAHHFKWSWPGSKANGHIFSLVDYRPNADTSIVIHTHIQIYTEHYPKVGLIEGTKGGGKEGKKGLWKIMKHIESV
jgi:hypothetical protein